MEEESMPTLDRRKSVRLDEKGKERKLKERLAARKKAKRGEKLAEDNEQTFETTGEYPDSSTV
jgi:hypothetical protein